MSQPQGNYGQRDPYEGNPQYGSAGGSNGLPYNPLMTNFRGGGSQYATDKLNLRKQGNPTLLASHSQPTYHQGGYHQQGGYIPPGGYYTTPYDPNYPPAQAPLARQPSDPQDAYTQQPKPVQQEASIPAKGPPAPAQVSAAASAPKVPVESETEYPRPHRGDSLLGVFFSDPGKFEGTIDLTRIRDCEA